MLTKAELETPRTAKDILAWVYAANKRFSATRELAAAARDGNFFAKELIHEALPIALFASRYYNASQEVTITHILGSQNYDAIVHDRRSTRGSVKYIEATVSDWSYVESLRMELLTRDGRAPSYGPVIAEGSKRRRTKLHAEFNTIAHHEMHEQHVAGVIATVRKKSQIRYPDNTALVVRVNDYGPFRHDNDVANLDRVARQTLLPLISGREFRVLALEGTRAVHLSYDI